MGKLVVTEFITLDGVIEDPGGAEDAPFGGWAFRFDRGREGDAFKLDELRTADVQLLGRRTYEGFAAAWPSRSDPQGFAEKMNTMPKVVVSTTLENPSWSNTTVERDLSGIPALKEQHAGDILVAGSARLVQGLLGEGLVDELRLMVFPLVAGGGKRLFADGLPETAFGLVEARPAGATVILRYERT
jgi:dihydrofolate reductase